MKHIRLTVDDETYDMLAARAEQELRTVPNTVRYMLAKWAAQSKLRGGARQGEADVED